MRLAEQERHEFLAEPHVAVLAVSRGGGGVEGPPLAVPLWYAYRPGEDLWILTPTGSLKARALRAAGAATLVVDTVQPRTRYVSVGCDVVAERAGTDDDRRALAERYLPAEAAAAFLRLAAEGIGEESVFTLRPRRWHTADLTI